MHNELDMSKRPLWGIYAIFCTICLFLLTHIGRPTRRAELPPREVAENAAWVTMTTDDRYVLGAAVLLQSIMSTKTQITNFDCLVTPRVSSVGRNHLRNAGWNLIEVAPLKSPQLREGFTRYADTYTKLQIWSLVQYQIIVYLDADVLILKNSDILFHSALSSVRHIAAADDCCDLFNPGVIVLRPDISIHSEMLQLIGSVPSYDGGDGGFLNIFFPRTSHVTRLSFIFNADQITLAIPRNKIAYQLEKLCILHFAGPKPWLSLKASGLQANVSAEQQRREVEGFSLTAFASLHDLWLQSYQKLGERLGEAYTKQILAMA
eukprot:TRINITY_DN1117_c0_g1_i1.p1 TRINITY_DN1117_c0_g1~~TRINITY_DN1117_c0_g1_i1.p1  ORF type:complete len:320 (-),score=38.35 TRINITY_DN1117_c0_g1_i1:729-1688(-)